MDILLELKDRIRLLEDHANFPGMAAAVRHIDVAEKHYRRALLEGDEDSFNDVIYRTNQAFEGFLKEAFNIFAGEKSDRKTPYQIEEYFLKNTVFKDRVMKLFTNYRQEWRNPSTHDHNIFFDEDEAILAISSVSSFAYILTQSMLEKMEEIKGAELAKSGPNEDGNDVSLINKVLEGLKIFNSDISEQGVEKEIQITAQLHGFLQGYISDSVVVSEMVIAGRLRPDLIVNRGDASVIIEVKRRLDRHSIDIGMLQLSNYLPYINQSQGVIYAPTDAGKSIDFTEHVMQREGVPDITIFLPQSS